MPPVLVTGAGGWLGRRLIAALAGEHAGLAAVEPDAAIRCLLLARDDPKPLLELSPRVEIQTGDLRRADDVRAFCRGAEGSLLFHCAGVIHPRLLTREFSEVNVAGSARLLDTALMCGVARVVVMSSNSPLGTNPDREHRFDESSPYRPYLGYGRSKMQLERLVAARPELDAVIVRAPWFYGPAQPARQTEFFRMIRRGRIPLVGDGGNQRSMAYVDNVCRGLLLCAQTPRARGETYWIADERPYAMSEIIDTVEQVMSRDFGIEISGKRLRLPNLTSELALAGDRLLQSAGLYVQKLHVLSEMNKNIACTIAKAQRDLGYAPEVELEEGMRRSIDWCLRHEVSL